MDTFVRNGKFAAFCDLDWLDRLVTRSLWNVFNSLNNLVPLEDFAEDNVLAVEVTGNTLDHGTPLRELLNIPGSGCGDEELRAIGISSGVGHA